MKNLLMRNLITYLSILAMLGILAACASQPGTAAETPAAEAPVIITAIATGAVESEPLTSIKTSTPLPPTYVDEMRVVTIDDSGKSLQFAVGDRFILSLGAGYDWTIEVTPDNVLVHTADAAPAGSQGIYEAAAPGQVRLSANGDPSCLKESPGCMMPSILVEVTIIVK